MKRHALSILGAALAVAVFSACVPAVNPEPSTPTAGPEVSPTAPTEAAPLLTLKVASYNVLVGGGHDPAYDANIPEEFRGTDRAQLLIDYLRSLDADIIGLQETTGWDEGTPPYIEVLGRELGMNYFASSPRSDSSLLTRLEILEAEDLSTETTSIIRARLLGPDGEPVNVYVAHLNWDSVEERACSTQFLLREMDRYADQRTFLIGDMNFKGKVNQEWSPKALREAGWQLLDVDRKLGFDQIWAPGSLKWDATAWTAAQGSNLKLISDHSPVGLELLIYSPSGDERAPAAPTAAPLSGLENLPEGVNAAISNARLAFMQQEGVPCNEQRWNPYWRNVNMVGLNLHLYGQEEWQSYANWSAPISDGEGMMVDFQFEEASEFNIFLEHGDWGTPDFRKFGIVIAPDGTLYPDVWTGAATLSDATWDGMTTLEPARWYRLLLVNGGDGRLAGFVWDVDEPGKVSSLQMDLGPDWVGVPLRLATGANLGGVDIRDVGQIVFDSLE